MTPERSSGQRLVARLRRVNTTAVTGMVALGSLIVVLGAPFKWS